MTNFILSALKIQEVIIAKQRHLWSSRLLKLLYPLGDVTYIQFSPAKLIVKPNDKLKYQWIEF